MIAVVRGNDFRLRIPIRRNVVHNNGTTSYEPLDISALNDLHVFLEDETMCAKELSWFIDTENASSIIADVPACMQEGKYALILLGKYSDDRRFRSKERKQLRLVETNEKANVTPFDLDGFDAYALDTMIVMDGRGRDGLTAYEIAVAHGYEGTEEEWIESLHNVSDADKERWNSKQDALTFDNLPTQGSNNPVKSSGIYNRMHILTTAIQQVSEDVVALQQEMPEKQNVLTFDNTPTANSNNPVKSGGVYNAIEAAKNAIQVTTEELRTLKNNDNLIPGMNYKITDYNPETTGTITIAGQNFEISNQVQYNNVKIGTYNIVLKATSNNELSEQGLAVRKRYTDSSTTTNYETYWNNTKFGAWTINVILDINDDRRPSWCKGEGAPVWINYMKDEWGNEAPFDFKVYGFALPEGTSLNQTENVKELDEGYTWFKGNRWHIFTYYNDNDFALDASLTGNIKNVKLTSWNIIVGEITDSVIEGSCNTIINSNDSEGEPLEKLIIKGYDNRIFCDGASYDYHVIQGINNIIVNSSVTFGKSNSNCIIKDSESVYLGNYNNNIVIRNCSDINIGNNNSDWDITYAGNVYIGNNNIKDDNDTNPNYIHPGTFDGEIAAVGNIKIGNDNKNIRLYASAWFNIGDYNRSITAKCTEDGFQVSDCTIGNDNSISIRYDNISYIKIGDDNDINIYGMTTPRTFSLQRVIIGHANSFNMEGNEDSCYGIIINNYNRANYPSSHPLMLNSTTNNQRFYFEEGIWKSKPIND